MSKLARSLSINVQRLQARHRHLLALAGVLLIALFLRTYHLSWYPPGLYPDEAMNGNNALEAIRTGEFKVFYPENNGREGLFINIQALFLLAFSLREPWVLRLPSPIFGTLTVLGVYLLTRELFGKKVALLAAFLLATSFWHLIFSRIGFRAITAPFYGAWGLWLLVVALRVKKYSRSLLLSLSAGLVLGLGFHSYIAFRVLPVLAVLLFLRAWLSRRREPEPDRRWPALAGVFLLGLIVSAAPLLIHFARVPQDFFSRTAQLSLAASEHPWHDLLDNTVKTAKMFHFKGDENWRHNFSGRPELPRLVGLFFLVGLALAVWRLREKTPGYWLCLAWLAVAAAPVIVANGSVPHALRAILMIPPVFMLSACGGIFLYEKVRERLQRRTALRWWQVCAAVLLCSLLIQVYQLYFHRWGPDRITRYSFDEKYVNLGRRLLARPPEVKKYVLVCAPGVDVRGFPTATQTVMFITDTFLPEQQREKNIYYVKQEETAKIPVDAELFMID
ncbi:MAG TPA: glycosyltransferase family 39 protein [Blastocatellia bacterium]|nr:glycosyltransferase family 39 protein [Blastocatellia bacterium]